MPAMLVGTLCGNNNPSCVTGPPTYVPPLCGYTQGNGYAPPSGSYSPCVQHIPVPMRYQGSPGLARAASPDCVRATPPNGYKPTRALQHNLSPQGQARNRSASKHPLGHQAIDPLTRSTPVQPQAQPQLQPHPQPMSNVSLAITSKCPSDLTAGDTYLVQGKEYLLNSKLGQGAFGKVWLVSQQSQGSSSVKNEYALKVIKAREGENSRREDAVFEVQVLQHLTASLSQDAKSKHRVPLYVGHCFSQACVSCVMTRLPGKPFDQWLYGVDENAHKTIDPDVLMNGSLPEGKFRSMSLVSACSAATTIIASLSPVLGTLQSFAFHRDISSHNILVHHRCHDPKQGPTIDVSLIDFGLATSSRKWGECWKTKNICGDPRYWTPAAWMNLTFGPKYLETHPNQGFVRQYKERLDHFSIGIFALEAFFALWHGRDDSGVGHQIEPVRMAWCSYWKLAIQTFQNFHGMELSTLRRRITSDQTINHLDHKLKLLQNALEIFAKNVPNHACTLLFTLCADFLAKQGTLSWADVVRYTQKQPSAKENTVIDVPIVVAEPRRASHRRVRTLEGCW